MLRQALKNLMIQHGLKLLLGSFISLFVGYTLPITILQIDVSPLDELIFACAVNIDAVAALLRWDLAGILVAIAQPLLREPLWLVVGRYALAITVAGAALVLLAFLMTVPSRLRAAWAGTRLKPLAEPSEAAFEDPDDARDRMGRRR